MKELKEYIIIEWIAKIDTKTKQKKVVIEYIKSNRIKKLSIIGDDNLKDFFCIDFSNMKLKDLKAFVKDLKGEKLIIKINYSYGRIADI